MARAPSGFAGAENGERQGELDEHDQGDQGFEGHGTVSLFQASVEIIAASGRVSWMRAIKAIMKSVVICLVLQVRRSPFAAFDLKAPPTPSSDAGP
jgi:hypothetical protein